MGNGNISRLNKASQGCSSTLIPDPQLLKLSTFSLTAQGQDPGRTPFIPIKLRKQKKCKKEPLSETTIKRGRAATAASRDFPNHHCESSTNHFSNHPQSLSPSSSPSAFLRAALPPYHLLRQLKRETECMLPSQQSPRSVPSASLRATSQHTDQSLHSAGMVPRAAQPLPGCSPCSIRVFGICSKPVKNLVTGLKTKSFKKI